MNVAKHFYKSVAGGTLICDSWGSFKTTLDEESRAVNLDQVNGSIAHIFKQIGLGNVQLYIVCSHRYGQEDLEQTQSIMDDAKMIAELTRLNNNDKKNFVMKLYAVSKSNPITDFLGDIPDEEVTILPVVENGGCNVKRQHV